MDMEILKKDLFQNVLGLVALLVAGVAAFFSVMGIGMLFSGAAISVMIMATALECGKIVATSFLYRYWNKATRFLKVYLVAAVLTLVVITSLGVFGWLSAAYQSSAIQYANSQQQTISLVEQKKMVNSQLDVSKQRLDNLTVMRSDQEKRMSDALNNTALSRNPTQLRQIQDQNILLIRQTTNDMAEERSRYNEVYSELFNIDKKILDSKVSNKTKDIVTFQFVADAIGWSLNTTVKWFIVLIIVVFDPLAVCLILAYNVIAYGKSEGPPISEKETPTIDTTPIITPEIEKKNRTTG